MTRRAARILASTAAAVCALGLLPACSGSSKKTASTSPSSSPAPATTRKPTPTPAPVNPLTGVGSPSKLPVIAVKIDDTGPGRPQVNIDRADIVYIEQAEGGLSRLVAVFGTNKPVVGYVRSTRPSDPELLLQYGKITLAASGGGGDALPILDASGLTSWINDRGARFYARTSRSASSYVNLTLDLAQVAATVKTPAPRSIGLTWSKGLGKTTWTGRGASIQTLVGSTPVNFRWDAGLKRFVRYIDGARQLVADGRPVSTPNVIVQNCVIVPHYADVDVNGNPSKFTHTIGTGSVTVFRNGHGTTGTWSRKSVSSGTILRDRSGNVIPLTPGGAWVVLAAKGTVVVAS